MLDNGSQFFKMCYPDIKISIPFEVAKAPRSACRQQQKRPTLLKWEGIEKQSPASLKTNKQTNEKHTHFEF